MTAAGPTFSGNRAVTQKFGEVPSTHFGGWNRGDLWVLGLVGNKALIISEDKELILNDRTSNRSPKLVSFERGLLGRFAICDWSEVGVIGVESAITDELECRSVDLVAPRLDGGLDDSATSTSEFGRSYRRIHLKFLRGFHRREDVNGVDQTVIVVQAVQNEVVGLRSQSVDGQRCAAGLRVAKGLSVVADARGLVAVGATSYAGGQKGELREVTSVQRQVCDLVNLNNLANGRGRRIRKRHSGSDFNCLSYFAGLQSGAELLLFRDVQEKILYFRLEGGGLDLHVIGSAHHGGNRINALGVRRRRIDLIGGSVRRRNRGIGDYGTLNVRHRPLNAPGVSLSKK